LFSLTGINSERVYEFLAERKVNAPAGNFYAIECSRHLGLGDDGAIRAGLAPYNTVEEIDRLLEGIVDASAQL
jgi:selenocysteine lyase/cysteine desulfurase